MDPLNQLAVFSRRVSGERRQVELAGPTEGRPALIVEFEIPTPLQLAQIEAKVRNAIQDLRRGQLSLQRYDFPDTALTDDEIEALSTFIAAVESALALWRAWNFALVAEDGTAVRAPLDMAFIIDCLSVVQHRQAWVIHLDQASPLERAEGNVSGASPSMSSDRTALAPNTAPDASSSPDPAPEAEPHQADASAPEPTSTPEAPKED